MTFSVIDGVERAAPVSYTHLDVYKRQRPYKERIDCVQERMVARLSREYPDREEYEEMVRLLFEYVGTVEDAVSYTHLAMIKDGRIIDTVSLYDLRHPAVKNFIIEFGEAGEKQR